MSPRSLIRRGSDVAQVSRLAWNQSRLDAVLARLTPEERAAHDHAWSTSHRDGCHMGMPLVLASCGCGWKQIDLDLLRKVERMPEEMP